MVQHYFDAIGPMLFIPKWPTILTAVGNSGNYAIDRYLASF